jgi:hypothetical protein
MNQKEAEEKLQELAVELQADLAEVDREELRERLAKFLHEDIWAHWMNHFFNTCGVYIDSPDHDHFGTGQVLTIYPGKEQHWRRQMATFYEDLEPQEKKSDQELADKLMKLLFEEE